jgi:hypothetical protein
MFYIYKKLLSLIYCNACENTCANEIEFGGGGKRDKESKVCAVQLNLV